MEIGSVWNMKELPEPRENTWWPVWKEMKANQTRTSKACLFSACSSKGVSHCHLHLADPRQAEEWKSFTVENRGGFRDALIGGCWHEEANRRGTAYVIDNGCIFGFLLLILNWKWGQRLGKLAVIKWGHWGPIFPEVIIWLLGQLARDGGLTSCKS